jgi:hypothetical protein
MTLRHFSRVGRIAVLRHGENARQGQDCCYFQEGYSHLSVLRETIFAKYMNEACFYCSIIVPMNQRKNAALRCQTLAENFLCGRNQTRPPLRMLCAARAIHR